MPVLVDFGFAEKYDLEDEKAFCSNLTYGTPEVCLFSSTRIYVLISLQYLSPERARGLPHDTRRADIWSLGVTFFEILIGRTPFEHTEGEPFATKAALEDYWARTVCTLAYDLGPGYTHYAGTDAWKMAWQLEDVQRRREDAASYDSAKCRPALHGA